MAFTNTGDPIDTGAVDAGDKGAGLYAFRADAYDARFTREADIVDVDIVVSRCEVAACVVADGNVVISGRVVDERLYAGGGVVTSRGVAKKGVFPRGGVDDAHGGAVEGVEPERSVIRPGCDV